MVWALFQTFHKNQLNSHKSSRISPSQIETYLYSSLT
uniref:Uncharacterized protein n=1 Tax=Arundo donax TaxID=35708 RepID=A0A0A9N0B4_ARUDO